VEATVTEKLWKAVERKICRYLGMERQPITGRIRGSAPDGKSTWLAAEIKHRRKLPTWLLEAMDQARAGARDGQLPIAVLHQQRMEFPDCLVVLRASDFKDWFGDKRPLHEASATGGS
jgi:hypothetical protein